MNPIKGCGICCFMLERAPQLAEWIGIRAIGAADEWISSL